MDEQDQTECRLIAAIAKADLEAFERLHRRYDKRVFQYAYTFLRDRTAAEEVATDTMMAVWHGAADFQGRSRVSTWILGITRHKALDAVRARGRPSPQVSIDEAMHLSDAKPGPAETLAVGQQAALTRQALAMLSADHQEILRLVFYEELPYEEIASLLRIPSNTVKTRVYYAKQRLKQAFGQLALAEVAE
jgi:RNA polymerase sigma-70 factor (ECF subfamily)